MTEPLPRITPSRPPVNPGNRWTNAIHLVLALAGWVLFGVFWVRVFYRTPPADSALGVLIVGLLLLVSVTLTVGWVRHNLILSQKFAGRRHRIREARPDWTHDRLGRPVDTPGWETLQAATEIVITIDPRTGHKVYRSGRP